MLVILHTSMKIIHYENNNEDNPTWESEIVYSVTIQWGNRKFEVDFEVFIKEENIEEEIFYPIEKARPYSSEVTKSVTNLKIVGARKFDLYGCESEIKVTNELNEGRNNEPFVMFLNDEINK